MRTCKQVEGRSNFTYVYVIIFAERKYLARLKQTQKKLEGKAGEAEWTEPEKTDRERRAQS